MSGTEPTPKRRRVRPALTAEQREKGREAVRRWRAKNLGRERERGRRRYWSNPDAAKATTERWREQNRERILAQRRAKYAAAKGESYRSREEIALTAKISRERSRPRRAADQREREAAKSKRTPPWLSDAQRASIIDVYKTAALLTKRTGVLHHVDHVVPLRGKTVSGLHVPWNLRAIPAATNLRKHNKLLER